jgi:hypothetical protein
VLQSWVKEVPGVQEEPGEGVVVVVVVVVTADESKGQEAGQKPYSPSTWVPAVVVLVLHQGADWPTLVQAW